MPITANLSKIVYDRLGDQVVKDLVSWLNAVDAEFRTALRETNETNFARFDANQAQRFARVDERFADFEVKIERRFAEAEVKIERRLAEADQKNEQRFAAIERQLVALDAKIDRVAIENREFMERALKEQTRWMFLSWASLLVAIIGFGLRG